MSRWTRKKIHALTGAATWPTFVLDACSPVFYGLSHCSMARFHVRDTFATDDNRMFVLAGFAIEGEVAAGMSIRLPFRENVAITAAIDRIEHLRRLDGDILCLCVGCAEPRETALWQAMNIQDRIVDIIQAG